MNVAFRSDVTGTEHAQLARAKLALKRRAKATGHDVGVFWPDVRGPRVTCAKCGLVLVVTSVRGLLWFAPHPPRCERAA